MRTITITLTQKEALEEIKHALELLYSIQQALGTEEVGEALVEVARNAHKAEQELAAIDKRLEKAELWPEEEN